LNVFWNVHPFALRRAVAVTAVPVATAESTFAARRARAAAFVAVSTLRAAKGRAVASRPGGGILTKATSTTALTTAPASVSALGGTLLVIIVMGMGSGFLAEIRHPRGHDLEVCEIKTGAFCGYYHLRSFWCRRRRCLSGRRGGFGKVGVRFAHEWAGIMMQFTLSASPHFSDEDVK